MSALSTCQANLTKARAERDACLTSGAAKDAQIADLAARLAACEAAHPAPLPPASFYASPTGDDSKSGTQAAPFRTFAKLASRLSPDQVGMLLAGEYREDVDLRTPRVTVTAEPGRTTFRGQLRMTDQAPASIVEKLIIRATHNYVPILYGNDQVLRECDCSNSNDGIGVHVTDGGMFPRPQRVRIEGCRIHHCGQLVPRTNQEHGVYAGQADGGIVSNCLIHHNADRGMQVYYSSKGWLVENTIIAYNDRGFGFGGEASNPSSDNVLRACVIAHNKEWNAYGSWGGPRGTGNVVRDSVVWTPDTGQWTGAPAHSGVSADGFTALNLTVADPGFADPARGDFTPSLPAAQAIAPVLAPWLRSGPAPA